MEKIVKEKIDKRNISKATAVAEKIVKEKIAKDKAAKEKSFAKKAKLHLGTSRMVSMLRPWRALARRQRLVWFCPIKSD